MTFDPVAEQAVEAAIKVLMLAYQAAVESSGTSAATAISNGMSEQAANDKHFALITAKHALLNLDITATSSPDPGAVIAEQADARAALAATIAAAEW